MRTQAWAILLVVLCTGLTSTAQVFYKTGAEKLPLIFWNWNLIIGMALYGLGAGILILSLRGGDLSVLYPIIATSYVWVAILSYYLFNDRLPWARIAGLAIIIIGICLVGWGSKQMPLEAPI